MSCDANRFVTWNINSLKVRLPHVLRYLDEKRPTLVALQELKCVTEQVPTEPFAERGYQILAFGQPTYNGVALIAPNEWQAQEVHRRNVHRIRVEERLRHGIVRHEAGDGDGCYP